MKNHFTIKGKKDFVVDKVGDEYIGYDRIDLEYYSFDEIGAEILYCISKNFSLDKIIEVIQDEYDVNYADCKEAIINFRGNTYFTHYLCQSYKIRHLFISKTI